MQDAHTYFTDEQREKIAEAVAEAEGKTTAEIVPVVATASGRYDRPEDIVGLWVGALFLIAAWFLVPSADSASGSWGFSWAAYALPILVVALVAGFILGVAAGSSIGWLRRLFTPDRQMIDEVSARARAVFFDSRVHRTAEGTGILVYLSLYERMAAVIADDTVVEQIGQAAIDELCDALTTGLQDGDAVEAVCATISRAGERLAGVLPCDDENPNELADNLVILDAP